MVRRLILEEPTEQITFFSMGKYNHQLIGTNMPLMPINTWIFYCGPTSVKLIVKQFQRNYPLGKVPRKHFAARGLFSYLLVHIQSHQLVQTVILTDAVSSHESLNGFVSSIFRGIL
jgi:hypothetical protein